MTSWTEIWHSTVSPVPLTATTQNAHELALVLNGYDSAGAGQVTINDFIEFASTWVKGIGFQNGDSVFEVGCGAGSFLQAIYNVTSSAHLAGSDSSSNLIKAGRGFFPHLDLRIASGATALGDTFEFNHIVSFSVFHYFDSLDYAAQVVKGMKKAASRSVSLLDLPDVSTKWSDIQFRRSLYPEGEYERKYEGLDHLYYSRDWIADLFPSSEWSVRIENQTVPNYTNAKFRFNMIAVRI